MFNFKLLLSIFFFLVFLFYNPFFLDSDFLTVRLIPEEPGTDWELYVARMGAILRFLPKMIVGVVSFLLSIVLLFLLPFFFGKGTYIFKMLCILFFLNYLVLMYIGMYPPGYPYFMAGVIILIFYFFFF